MSAMITCENCVFHWIDEGDRYGLCHFDSDNRMPEDIAPCEYDDYDDYDSFELDFDEDDYL